MVEEKNPTQHACFSLPPYITALHCLKASGDHVGLDEDPLYTLLSESVWGGQGKKGEATEGTTEHVSPGTTQ